MSPGCWALPSASTASCPPHKSCRRCPSISCAWSNPNLSDHDTGLIDVRSRVSHSLPVHQSSPLPNGSDISGGDATAGAALSRRHRTTSGPSVTDDSQAAVCVKVQSRAVSADQSSPASERRARLHAGPATDTTTGAPGGASARVERSPEVGSPGASQPPAPTDPGVTVSRHRAPLTGLRTRGTTASARTGRALVR
jgi:hypothetical protein